MKEQLHPKVVRYWALFDWANSAFALVITVAIFPPYFSRVSPDIIHVFGQDLSNGSLYSFSISLSYILILLISPLLSGIADYTGRRVIFLKIFTLLGGLACLGLYAFSHSELWWVGLMCFMLGLIGFSGSLVFNNSLLPLITSEESYDRVSALGFIYGYIGSVLLLVLNLLFIQKPQWFGLSDAALASRVSFVTVGLWWIIFGFISFSKMPKDDTIPFHRSSLRSGYLEVRQVFMDVTQQKYIIRFLFSFFFYIAGVHTVLFLAAIFAEVELNFSESGLILLVLLLQLVAALGARLFAYISHLRGNKISIIIMLIIWFGICVVAYFLESQTSFYILSCFVGLVMGGIQSQSRSTYTKLLEKNEDDVTSYFSLYDIFEKLAIIIGTLMYGLLTQWFGSMRASILGLSVFFFVGLILFLFVKIKHARSISPY